MKYGYHCEECEEAVWPENSRAELQWLKSREHVVREVASHVQSGLDGWMTDGLEFLSRHAGHEVSLTRKS